MIRNRKDYAFYLEADRIIAGKKKKGLIGSLFFFFFPDPISKFMYLLRKTEYLYNCHPYKFGKIRYKLCNYRFQKISLKLGFSIPINVFGPGLLIPHYGTIVINSNTKVGSNCVLHSCVCIAGPNKEIGDNAYLSTGVIIAGKAVKIGNNVSIGANSLVNKSFQKNNIMIAGTPAKILKERSSWYIEDDKIYQLRVDEINNLRRKLDIG